VFISFQILPVLFKKQRPDLPAEISILLLFIKPNRFIGWQYQRCSWKKLGAD
jgi:hypothetical protein